MKIRDGPAAVTGDEFCIDATDLKKLGRRRMRTNRESENLSENISGYLRGQGVTITIRGKTGTPRINKIDPGIFFALFMVRLRILLQKESIHEK